MKVTCLKSLLVPQGGALLGAINALHTSFPENPMTQYRMQCELILERLELHDLLHKELQRLDRYLQSDKIIQQRKNCLTIISRESLKIECDLGKRLVL